MERHCHRALRRSATHSASSQSLESHPPVTPATLRFTPFRTLGTSRFQRRRGTRRRPTSSRSGTHQPVRHNRPLTHSLRIEDESGRPQRKEKAGRDRARHERNRSTATAATRSVAHDADLRIRRDRVRTTLAHPPHRFRKTIGIMREIVTILAVTPHRMCVCNAAIWKYSRYRIPHW